MIGNPRMNPLLQDTQDEPGIRGQVRSHKGSPAHRRSTILSEQLNLPVTQA